VACGELRDRGLPPVAALPLPRGDRRDGSRRARPPALHEPRDGEPPLVLPLGRAARRSPSHTRRAPRKRVCERPRST
jgi:hypothetical protein